MYLKLHSTFPQCSIVLIVLAIENMFGLKKKKKQITSRPRITFTCIL